MATLAFDLNLTRRKRFFFEKKNQKTFLSYAVETRTLPDAPSGRFNGQGTKVFWFFFSKKNFLLFQNKLRNPPRRRRKNHIAMPRDMRQRLRDLPAPERLA